MVRKIRQAAVIGAGTMGTGIAALLAGVGVNTLLLDILPPDLKDAEKNDPVARNRIAKSGMDRALMSYPPVFRHPSDMMRITIGNMEDDLEKLKGCDWIIEAVIENLKIKQDLFNRIEALKKADAIVSTNTSGIPLKKISESLSRDFKTHFLGTHFFNPVRYMTLLEIIPGEDTRPEIIDFMTNFGERTLGKGIVLAKDTPNFIGNRIGVYGIVKAMQLMLEDGLTIPEVDALFGPNLGRPKTAMFKTADLVGLDVLGHVAGNTYELVVDDEDRDGFLVPEFITRMIGQNLLGKKTNAGFYKTELTPEFKKVRKVIDPATLEYSEYDRSELPCLAEAKKTESLSDKIRTIVYGKDRGARFVWKAVAGSLIYAAKRIPEISDTVLEIDKAMKWGFNFEMGPFELWDALGLEESIQKMEADGFSIPEPVKQMVTSGNNRFYKSENNKFFYYDFKDAEYKEEPATPNIITLNRLKSGKKLVKTCPSASLIDLDDGVFCCEFHTKMNAINREIVDFLYDAFEVVDQNGIGVVIGNQTTGLPGTFSVGGDLAYMAGLAQQGKFSDMESFLKDAQMGMLKARYSYFPVVTAPYGLALGGGCEICLSSDRIVAHADLNMGLVEFGVGLIPAGGGCLNLWRKVLNSIPESVREIDLAKFFIPTFMSIALAKVSMSAADARANGFLGPADKIISNRDYLIAEAKKEVIRLVETGYSPPIKSRIRVMGEAAQGMVKAEIHNMLNGNFISEYDAFIAEKIAYVMSGGNVRDDSEVEEEVILTLERETFIELWKQEKTQARVEHMLKTGKPLRN